MSLHEAILQGSVSRLRPVVMTALMAMLGLLPAALSTSVGSETVKPFAVVIIGGLITATLLTLTMLPALYRNFEQPHTRGIAMKEIRAYIEPFMLSKLTQTLLEIPDFPGMSVSDCEGFGASQTYRGTRLHALRTKKTH